MANRPKEAEVKRDVEADLDRAVVSAPDVMPITIWAIATRTGYHFKTIKKYLPAAELEARRERQRRFAGSRQTAADARIVALEEEVRTLKAMLERHVASRALIEANAKELGIDPDRLYEPMPSPARARPASSKAERPRPRLLRN